MIRLIYNGLERCDFIYYLSLLLAGKSTQIVVNDTSISGDLFKIFNIPEDSEQYFEYKNIIFTRNLDEIASFEALNGIDYYIEYRGLNVVNNGTTPNTFHLIMPNYTKEGVDMVSDLKSEGDAMYIPRDFCSRKVTDKSLALTAGLVPSWILGHISLSAEDMSSYYALTINGQHKFTHLSDDMNNALVYVFATVTMTGEKEALKYFKKVRRIKK